MKLIDARKLRIAQPEGSAVYYRNLSVVIQFAVLNSLSPSEEQKTWDNMVIVYGSVPGSHGYKVCTAY